MVKEMDGFVGTYWLYVQVPMGPKKNSNSKKLYEA